MTFHTSTRYYGESGAASHPDTNKVKGVVAVLAEAAAGEGLDHHGKIGVSGITPGRGLMDWTPQLQ